MSKMEFKLEVDGIIREANREMTSKEVFKHLKSKHMERLISNPDLERIVIVIDKRINKK